MARKAQAFIDRHPCGMDDSLIRSRSSNRQRPFGYFNITELEWNDWNWHIRHIIRDPQVLGELSKLSQEEETAITMAWKEHIPVGITPYTVSLMDPDNRGIWDMTTAEALLRRVRHISDMRL